MEISRSSSAQWSRLCGCHGGSEGKNIWAFYGPRCSNYRCISIPLEQMESAFMTPEEEGGEVDTTNPKDLLGVLKPQIQLVPPASIIYEALAMEDGAIKYGPYNWRQKKVQLSIYIAALMRHVYDFWDGEDNARDSGKPHLGHAKACLGIIIDALETGNLIDDRPVKGSATDLIERFTKTKEGK